VTSLPVAAHRRAVYARGRHCRFPHNGDVTSGRGELFTRAALDHESRADYALYVTASDRRLRSADPAETGSDVTADDGGGGGSLSSQALVMVRVRDVNDNAPRIDVHVLFASSSSSTSPGPVATLRDSDRSDDTWRLEVSEGVPEGDSPR